MFGESRVGSYALLERCWVGPMSERLRARDARGATVHVERLLPSVCHDADARARWARRVDAQARMSHPNVVRVIDAGDAEGVPYLVTDVGDAVTMRAIAGSALSPSRGARRPPADLPNASVLLHLSRSIASALLYAERDAPGAPVAHGALADPDHTWIDAVGQVRVDGFGLAYLLGDHAPDDRVAFAALFRSTPERELGFELPGGARATAGLVRDQQRPEPPVPAAWGADDRGAASFSPGQSDTDPVPTEWSAAGGPTEALSADTLAFIREQAAAPDLGAETAALARELLERLRRKQGE